MSGPGDAQTSLALAEPDWRSDVLEGTCSIDNCEKSVRARGWCSKHYQRFMKYGDPTYVLTLLDRLLKKTVVAGPDECWLWTGVETGKNARCHYGKMKRAGQWVQAHRVAYELLVGPIPGGLVIDHLCRVTLCINPRHLEPVTVGENNRRGIGVGGTNSRKTHCERGHELRGGNVRIQAYDGGRRCIACERLAGQRRRERLRRPRVA